MTELKTEARRIRIGGRVQGVGFRPHVYRLARSLNLGGWVRNDGDGVSIHIEGAAELLERFQIRLLTEIPPQAQAILKESRPAKWTGCREFLILASQPAAGAVVPHDLPPCPECVTELFDPKNRRYRYPFISCSQCGPRYSLIEALPYDRSRTGMAGFDLCPDCQREYVNPDDRRFHAQSIGCPACGPVLRWLPGPFGGCAELDQNNPIDQAARAEGSAWQECLDTLKDGSVVAIRAVGGYQLAADATNPAAIDRLRRIKQRPDKPFAVLFANLAAIEAAGISLPPAAAEALTSPARPIVPLDRNHDCMLPQVLAPGLNSIGVMLPNSPLQTLLLTDFGGPLVMTSANRSGEPMLTEFQALPEIDGVLDHDRPITNPVDDPVMRVIDGAARPLRLGRGDAPLEWTLPKPVDRPTLALGGQMKVTLALAWGDRAVVSAHIGDLDSPAALAAFIEQADRMQHMYGIRAEQLICDHHPDYQSHRWARNQPLPWIEVPHHKAHASALMADTEMDEPALVFVWDGMGLGDDKALWGGEAFYGQPGQWRRVGSLLPFPLPGGERASREPWRCALGLALAAGHPWRPASIPEADTHLIEAAWQQGLNCPPTHSVGRLFDAAAAFCGLGKAISHEGQAAMWLESLADADSPALPLAWQDHEALALLDWRPLLPLLADSKHPVADRAGIFHASLAEAMVDLAERLQARYPAKYVGLSGGVFQNRLLCERACRSLRQAGFTPLLHKHIPCNDAGLSLGQLVEYAARSSTP